MRTKEILAKTIIVPSKLPCADYVINPYVGCSFACGYCYASFMGRFVGEPDEAWGFYVYVKINAVALFEREIERLQSRAPNATLMMSSVTDAWQGLEKKHRLARGILAALATRRYDGLVSLLTKSPLVLRDLDLIQAMPNRELGVTVTSPDDALGRELECRAPAMQQRFEILRRANVADIPTYAFIGPLLPHFGRQPDRLQDIFRRLADVGTRTIFAEQLNTSAYIRRRLEPLLRDVVPEVRRAYAAARGRNHREVVDGLVQELAARYGFTVRLGEIIDHARDRDSAARE